MGGQDDLAYARRFTSSVGATFTMLFDPTLLTWQHYRIPANSALWVLDRTGNRVGDVFVGIAGDHIEELLALAA